MFKSSGFSLPFYRKETLIYEKLFLNAWVHLHGRCRAVDDMGDVTPYYERWPRP